MVVLIQVPVWQNPGSNCSAENAEHEDGLADGDEVVIAANQVELDR